MIQATIPANYAEIKKTDLGVASYLASITVSKRQQFRIPLALYRLGKASDVKAIAMYADVSYDSALHWLSWYKRVGIIDSLKAKGSATVYFFTDPLIYTFIRGIYKAYEETMVEMEKTVNGLKQDI